MDNIKQYIETLKNDTSELFAEKNKDFIEYFNEMYSAEFGEDRNFNNFCDLFAEDEEGYFDPCDLVMDENDIICFMKWRYCLSLLMYMESVTDTLEEFESGKQHTAKKGLEKTVSYLRKYKKQIKQIISVSENTIEKIDDLIGIADKYRK